VVFQKIGGPVEDSAQAMFWKGGKNPLSLFEGVRGRKDLPCPRTGHLPERVGAGKGIGLFQEGKQAVGPLSGGGVFPLSSHEVGDRLFVQDGFDHRGSFD
jgi:hypothetical protein